MSDWHQAFEAIVKESAPAITRKESLLNQSLALTTAGKLSQFEFLDQEAARLAISRALEAREAAKQAISKLREERQKKG